MSLTTDSGRVPSSLSPGRRRLTPLQMRTTSGPTSRNEVVPRVAEDQRLVSAGERRNRCARRRPAFRSCSETSAWSARESVIRAALFAARCRASLSQWGEENDGTERPRCARPISPPCPEGSLTPWLSLSLQVVEHSMFGGEKRRVFSASNVLDCDSHLPDDPVLFVRTTSATNWSRSPVLSGQLLS
jgi:hypothetical protein